MTYDIKAYRKAYYLKNKEKIDKQNKEQALATREHTLARMKKWYALNSEKAKTNMKEWHKKHPEWIKAHSAKMRKKHAAKKLADMAKRRHLKDSRTPKWLSKADLKEIISFYTLAKDIAWLSNEPLHVDHIIPLRGKNVSGLHVPWNLQILPRTMNLEKGNKVI